MDDGKLLDMAYSALEHSYSPYSGYKVGAALLCADGSVYTGCNVENASYGAVVCAERTALVKAVSDGRREFVKIAVVSGARDCCFPCGICRQSLFEFAPGLDVVCLGEDGEIVKTGLKDLFTHGFRLEG